MSMHASLSYGRAQFNSPQAGSIPSLQVPLDHFPLVILKIAQLDRDLSQLGSDLPLTPRLTPLLAAANIFTALTLPPSFFLSLNH